MEKMTQKERILQHMRKNGGITNAEAFRLYGITRLSGRIYELRQDGHDIRGKKCTSVNRYGKRVYYDLYVLGGEL